jgi:hypothetical protein
MTSEPRSRHLDALAPGVRRIAQRRADERDQQRAAATTAVDRVVADVDAATEGRCACGCGHPITDSSPSAYYAGAGCQQRWMGQHAHNPTEVYRRRDAADFPPVDSGVQTLNDPTDTGWANIGWVDVGEASAAASYGRAPVPHPAADRVLLYGPGFMPPRLAYRRHCDACGHYMEPRIYQAGDDYAEAFASAGPQLHVTPMFDQECSRCGAAMLGMVHVPELHRTVGTDGAVAGWTLELHTDYGRVRSTITALAVNRMTAQEQDAYFAQTWASMENDLARFAREWRGRRRPVFYNGALS